MSYYYTQQVSYLSSCIIICAHKTYGFVSAKEKRNACQFFRRVMRARSTATNRTEVDF